MIKIHQLQVKKANEAVRIIPLLQKGDNGGCLPLEFQSPCIPPSPRGIFESPYSMEKRVKRDDNRKINSIRKLRKILFEHPQKSMRAFE